MTKTTRARYTLEFKQEAVRLVDGGQSIAAAARTLGLVEQTLFNWVKAKREGKLSGADSKAVSAEQMEISRLRAELARVKMERDILDLQLEHDLLKKASKIIKKGLGVSLQLLTNREKTLLVAALKQTHALSDLLPELGLARSSYFYHRARLQIADKYAGARQAIADIFQLNHRCYGYRRIQAMLSRQCVRLSEKVVQRLMKQECLVVAKPKRRRYGSYLGEISPAPENLVKRDFAAAAPNEKWLTDVSEFQIAAGKVYLSPMIDCFDGQVVSWTIGTRPDAELVNTMLDAAIETIPADSERPVVHSDRGAQLRFK